MVRRTLSLFKKLGVKFHGAENSFLFNALGVRSHGDKKSFFVLKVRS
jgi:hypothetical protein